MALPSSTAKVGNCEGGGVGTGGPVGFGVGSWVGTKAQSPPSMSPSSAENICTQ